MREKRNILIIILLIIFIILNFSVYLINKKNVIYLGSITKIEVKNNNIKIYNEKSKLNLIKAKIYFNGSFINGYLKSDRGNINNKAILYKAYNESGTSLRFTEDLIAYTGKAKINISDANVITNILDGDKEIISNFLRSDYGDGIGLDFSLDYKEYKKVIYDIDNDGDKEYLYSLNLIEENKTSYSYVFIIDDDELKVINSKKGDITDQKYDVISFFKLIDFNDDGKYEIVLRLKNGEYGDNVYKIYNYDGEISEIK